MNDVILDFRQVEVVLWGWWEAGEQLQRPSNGDVDEEPYTIKSPASSEMTTKSPRGCGHGRHSSRPSDVMIIGYGHGRSEEKGQRYAYGY